MSRVLMQRAPVPVLPLFRPWPAPPPFPRATHVALPRLPSPGEAGQRTIKGTRSPPPPAWFSAFWKVQTFDQSSAEAD
jgi:hypothetical protein